MHLDLEELFQFSTTKMIYLHKLLPLALSPIALILLLMLWAAIKRSRVAALMAIMLLYVASMPALSDRIFKELEQHQLQLAPESLSTAQAIVVLSGMLSNVQGEKGVVPQFGASISRFFGGVELYRAGRAPQLVFTGGYVPWQGDQEPEGQVLRRKAMDSGVPASSIVVSGPAQNTAQEAAAVRLLLIGHSNKHIILVTSAFHMPRAKRLFEQAGFVVTAYPVDFKVVARETTPMDFLPSAIAFLNTDTAVREFLGRAFYALITAR
jgi:uncharacterized SAM-binding protein YcdF (DUF218 family)